MPKPNTTINPSPPTSPSPAPLDDPDVRSNIQEFQSFISFILPISIFGASTFAVIMGQMQDPAQLFPPEEPPRFSLSQVRTFLALAWLCFVLALAVAGYSSSVMTIWQQRAVQQRQQQHQQGAAATATAAAEWWKNWDRFGVVASIVLHVLIIVAFLFLSLALVAFVGVVGWVMVGLTSAAPVVVVALYGYQLRLVR